MQDETKTLSWFGAMLRIVPALVFVLIGSLTLLVFPASESVGALENERQSLKISFRGNSRLLKHRVEFTAQLEQLKSSDLPRVLPADRYFDTETHVNLSNAADRFNVTFSRFNSVGQVPRDFYRKHEYEIAFSGRYEDVVALLHHLVTTRDQVFTLEGYEVTGRGDGSITLTGSVFTYSYIEEDEFT